MNSITRLIDQKSVTNFFGKNLNTSITGAALEVCTISDYMRSKIYLNWMTNNGLKSVHSSRVINSCKRDISYFFDQYDYPVDSCGSIENNRNEFEPKKVLHRLGEIHDIYDCGKGQWIPAPLKIVEVVSENPCFFITGGTPTARIIKNLGRKLRSSGIARFIYMDKSNVENFKSKIECESLNDWLCVEFEDLESWANLKFNQISTEMEKNIDVDPDNLQIYDPKPGGQNTILKRWFHSDELQIEGSELRLARIPELEAWNTPYLIVQLRNSGFGVRVQESKIIEKSLFDVLRYGYDAMVGSPLTINKYNSKEYFVIRLWRNFPDPESRILAFGWPAQKSPNQKFTDWIFPIEINPIVNEITARLGLRVVNYDWDKLIEGTKR